MMSGSSSPAQREFDTRYASLTVGFTARFVRWAHTRDGWIHETTEGRYVGIRNGCFVIDVDGSERQLPEENWVVYHA